MLRALQKAAAGRMVPATKGTVSTGRTPVAHLQVITEILVIQLGDLELVGGLAGREPGAALALRIHQHRPPGCSGDHDTILNTQIISGKPLQDGSLG